MTSIAYFQIGKSGITEGAIDSIILSLKNHKIIRISCLKSSGRDRANIKTMAKEIIERIISKTQIEYSYSILGFTIILLNYRKKKSFTK